MTTADAPTVAAPRRPPLEAVRVAPVVVGIALLTLLVNRWGQALLDDGVRHRILAPPLIGTVRFGPPGGLVRMLLPVAVGVALVTRLPAVAATARWSRVLLLGAAAAGAWAVSLALVEGISGLTRPMELRGHYLLDVGQVGSPWEFLRTFTDRIDQYGTHVRSHPPGLVLLLWAMASVGLAGSGAAAALVIGGGVAGVPAVLLTVRELAGEAMARRALPFVVIAPVAVYVASTGDALFAGITAWAVALVVLATGRRDRRGDLLALAGGAAFGIAALLSYGIVLLVLLPVAVALARRHLRSLGLAALGGGTVIGLSAAAGFWWVDGLITTHGEYRESVASIRPYGYFLVANVAGLALIVGPAVVAGVVRWLRTAGSRRAMGLLLAPALAVVALANLSGMSKGEVERIWLPFAVWLLPAGALAAGGADAGSARRWLWVQAAAAIAIPLFVRTHW